MSEANNNFPVGTQAPPSEQPDNTHPLLRGVLKLTPARQLGLMAAFAISIAIAVAVMLWAQAPSYDLLYSGVAEKDAGEIIEALDKLGMEYKVEPGTGLIMVPSGSARELKLKLAAQGLPRSTSLGYELLDKDNGFGSSKSVETMR
ncbi:MAG: flagellar basal-body MS-ring/collar protein FliF, partial [Gammaproteobacteria bacterium]